MSEITIAPGDPRDPAATALLQASHALMQELFDPEDNHYLSIDALCTPDIRFLVARVDGDIRGCCALKIYDGYGEIKSMFVDPAARGNGLAQKLLSEIESTARREHLPALRLETGDLLYAAHRVYHANGFQICGPFGAYVESKSSLFMEKLLP